GAIKNSGLLSALCPNASGRSGTLPTALLLTLIGAAPLPIDHCGGVVRPACHAITLAPNPITSTASGFSIHRGHHREAGAICYVGTWIADGAPPRRSGRFGRRRHTPIIPRHALKARPCVCPMSGMPAC